MAEHKHWKALFPANYLGHQHLVDGKDMIVKIADVKEEWIQNQNGKEKKPVLYFEGDVLPLILNKTNAERIVEVLGEDMVDKWVGQKIQLGIEIVSGFGKTGPAVRVREFKP